MAKDDWMILGIVAVAYFLYSKGASAATSSVGNTGAINGVACVDSNGNVSVLPMGPCGPGLTPISVS